MKKPWGVLFFLFFSPFLNAQPSTPISPALQAFINQLEAQADQIQGGAVAILHKDKVIYQKTFGYQKGKTGTITSSTLFPLASVSKPVSGVAVALMVDKGKLSFEEKNKLAYLKNPVSLTNILGNTTGYDFPGNSLIEQGVSRLHLLQVLKRQLPQCLPGQCYSYSNTTFSLLEETLNAKGTTYAATIQQLRTALKTNGIQIIPVDPNLPLAYPHKKDKTHPKLAAKALPFPPYYPKTVPAAAGVFASLDGMIGFLKLSAGYRPDIISSATLAQLFIPIIANRDIEKWNIKWPYPREKIASYYGRGWRTLKAQDFPGKDLRFHAGGIKGATSLVGYIPSEEMGIIILANQDTYFPLENGMKFWATFLRTTNNI